LGIPVLIHTADPSVLATDQFKRMLVGTQNASPAESDAETGDFGEELIA
jgi:hypothetical protein